jgi:hypothetical protein
VALTLDAFNLSNLPSHDLNPSQALAGVGMGVANYRHDQERAARKRKKVDLHISFPFLSFAQVFNRLQFSPFRSPFFQITADQEMRESARENIRTEGGRTAEEVEEEVLKMLPLRDFDDEELDEQGKTSCVCTHLSSVFAIGIISTTIAPKQNLLTLCFLFSAFFCRKTNKYQSQRQQKQRQQTSQALCTRYPCSYGSCSTLSACSSSRFAAPCSGSR